MSVPCENGPLLAGLAVRGDPEGHQGRSSIRPGVALHLRGVSLQALIAVSRPAGGVGRMLYGSVVSLVPSRPCVLGVCGAVLGVGGSLLGAWVVRIRMHVRPRAVARDLVHYALCIVTQ